MITQYAPADPAGRLAALTYPTSHGGVRFKAKYGYAGGYLSSVQDFTGDVNGPVLLESFGYDALDRLTTATGPGGVTSIGYDGIGNITSKTGIAGTFTYDSTRKHAVKSAGGTSYDYDHNGNMTSRGGATIAWSIYNLPTTINAPNGTSAQFAYTPDRARWRQISSYAGGTETTIYVGGLLEKLTTSAGTRWKHLIPTSSGQVQVVRRSDGTSETLYVVTDHLGSTEAVLNAAGGVLMRGSFDVHGARRGSNWQGTPTTGERQAIEATTRDGYTGHEMLDNVNLVHMNGRVFDPVIGRFLSADPFIDGAYLTQGWNRYAYVHGRVMSAADPSGFKSRRYSARPLIWNGFYVSSNSITDGYTITLRPVPHPSEVNEMGGGIPLSIESRLPLRYSARHHDVRTVVTLLFRAAFPRAPIYKLR